MPEQYRRTAAFVAKDTRGRQAGRASEAAATSIRMSLTPSPPGPTCADIIMGGGNHFRHFRYGPRIERQRRRRGRDQQDARRVRLFRQRRIHPLGQSSERIRRDHRLGPISAL